MVECGFDVKDILTRAKRTALQAGLGVLTTVNMATLLGDFSTSKLQALAIAAGTAALAAGASVIWNAISQYLRCKTIEWTPDEACDRLPQAGYIDPETGRPRGF